MKSKSIKAPGVKRWIRILEGGRYVFNKQTKDAIDNEDGE